MIGNQLTPEQPSVPSPPSRDLPAGRHQFHREHLMTLIDNDARKTPTTTVAAVQHRPQWRRPLFALPAAAMALAGVAGAVVLSLPHDADTPDGPPVASAPLQFADPNAGTSSGASKRLTEMALVAATKPTVTAKPGQFVYVVDKATWVQREANNDTATVKFNQIVSDRQVWESVDGRDGWLIATGVGDPAEGISLAGGDAPQFTLPSHEMLAGFPTDPDELLKRIYAQSKGQGSSPDQEAFVVVGDLLSESYPPAQLYSTLFKVAAKIPGVMIVDDAVDATGRRGVAVARVNETSGERTELIFDAKDYTYLGSRTVLTRDRESLKAGTVTASSTITDRAIVDKMKQLPAGK
ncbi:CU044_5270 family protein [Actinoplanes xinjiangensis]|uniref:CU044_5270 family protein n=1 Tax=Actinoplanes xinjiangensis TaxID=512350 RepID=UPI00341DE455